MNNNRAASDHYLGTEVAGSITTMAQRTSSVLAKRRTISVNIPPPKTEPYGLAAGPSAHDIVSLTRCAVTDTNHWTKTDIMEPRNAESIKVVLNFVQELKKQQNNTHNNTDNTHMNIPNQQTRLFLTHGACIVSGTKDPTTIYLYITIPFLHLLHT